LIERVDFLADWGVSPFFLGKLKCAAIMPELGNNFLPWGSDE
jgi:hypothetical protein